MIIKNDIDKLKLDCLPVAENEVGELIELLERELALSARVGSPGIGLAAPQIGIAKQIAIIRINDLNTINLVNCHIDRSFDLLPFAEEGCLSFPDLTGETMRYQQIYCKNNLVYPYEFAAIGLTAVAIQHELDHLNKILLPEKIKQLPSSTVKLGPNDPCFCKKINPTTGKIMKYKKCCGKEK